MEKENTTYPARKGPEELKALLSSQVLDEMDTRDTMARLMVRIKEGSIVLSKRERKRIREGLAIPMVAYYLYQPKGKTEISLIKLEEDWDVLSVCP